MISVCKINGMELKNTAVSVIKAKQVITVIVEVDARSSKKCGEFLCHLGVKLSISETTSLEKSFLITATLHPNSSFLKKSITEFKLDSLIIGFLLFSRKWNSIKMKKLMFCSSLLFRTM